MIDIFSQLAQAGVMLYGGIAFGVLYTMFRLLGYPPQSRALALIPDTLLILSFFGLLAVSLLIATGGILRAYAMLAFGAGALLSMSAFSVLRQARPRKAQNDG
ncbi:MAG: hypothetical protein FWF10_10470 [Clostridiales bacterium]|nr:hypothetical protein [Clostridiales bacterium]